MANPCNNLRYGSKRISPRLGRSGTRYCSALPDARLTASAAKYPLRAAPSMVEGHPVAVQSPASISPGHPLSAADVTALEAVFPADAIAGTRYDAYQMQHLDSES